MVEVNVDDTLQKSLDGRNGAQVRFDKDWEEASYAKTC
jgi:hypothetical protein